MDKELQLKVKATVQGAQEVSALTNEVNRLTGAGQKSMTDPTERLRAGANLTRPQIEALGKEFDGLYKRIDPAYAATQRFNQGQATLQKGLNAGLITQRQYGEGMKLLAAEADGAAGGLGRTRSAATSLGAALMGLISAGAIIKFVNDAVQEFSKAESAFRGLESVANASGYGIGNAMKAAEQLSSDGLISVSESAKALQNLLSRGYSVDQAVDTLNRLKDSAAFNRAAHLSLGEAVVSATEGLKNENSTLVDNAGVTKNVAKMWEDYAKSLGVTTEQLTQQQKIDAEYQGIMQETAAQVGNAQKALEGYQGQMAQANQEVLKFKQSMGELLAPVMLAAAQFGTVLVTAIKFVIVGFQTMTVRLAQIASAFDRFFTAISNRDFSDFFKGLESDAQAAADTIDDAARQMFDGNLRVKDSLTGVADAQKIADNAAKRSASDNAALIKQRIADYKKLRDAIVKAWQDSIKAEKDYLAEAKKLRAEANAVDSKSLENASYEEIGNKEVSLRADLRIAQERLQRMVNEGGSLDDIRAQATTVQELADQYRSLTDVVDDGSEISRRADEAVRDSKLSLATALEKMAGEEKQRQQDQIKQLNDIDKAAQALQTTKTVTVDTDQATQAVGEIKTALDGLEDKTVTVTVQQVNAADAANATGATDSQGNPIYRDPVGFAHGGQLPGTAPHDRADNMLYRGTPGEWVIQRPAVRYYGSGLLHALNTMRLPKFALGGELGRSAVTRMAVPGLSASSGGKLSGLDRGTFVLPGGERVSVQAESGVFDRLAALALQSRKRR
ncbi:MAG: hypothetical protein LBE24_10690 [Methylobacillus sp.]|jgi:hypothetical protein|nr:hypothetical protein [Methylobacillus sp.]